MIEEFYKHLGEKKNNNLDRKYNNMGKTFKSLLIIVFVTLAGKSFGQGKIGVVGMGGVSTEKVERDSGNDEIDTRFTYKAGMVYDYSFTNHWSTNVGLQFAHQTYKEDFSGDLDKDKNIRRYNYLQAPLNVAYKVNFSETENVIFQFGGYLGVALGGSITSDEDGKRDIDYGTTKNNHSRFDGGVQFGFGTEYKDFKVMVNYDLGLYDFNNSNQRVEKNRGVNLSLTYYLWK